MFFPHPKEKKPKWVPLIAEDVELLKQYPRSFPKLPFFRHAGGISGVKAGQPFGVEYFYKWWIKACTNLGVEGVDLYGGTRHSSATALRALHSPEAVKRATMHTTNKAFERYLQIAADEVRGLYEDTRRCNQSATVLRPPQNP